MPFSPTASCGDWDAVFDHLIKPAVSGSGLGYDCERSQILGGPFIKDILMSLYSADVVVADLTDRNPNVFYELGVRHSLKGRTILISQNLAHAPSDLAGYGIIAYNNDLSGASAFKDEMKRVLRKIERDPERSDNPVSDYLKNRSYLIYDWERNDVMRRLASLHAELFDNASTIVKNLINFERSEIPILGVFSGTIEDILVKQYVGIGLETNVRLKEILLHLQKLDYFAKLLTTFPAEERAKIKPYYEHHARAAVGGILTVRDSIQDLIQGVRCQASHGKPRRDRFARALRRGGEVRFVLLSTYERPQNQPLWR